MIYRFVIYICKAHIVSLTFFFFNSFVSYHFVLGKEGYEELRTCMKSVFREMKDLETSGISFQGRHFNIEW